MMYNNFVYALSSNHEIKDLQYSNLSIIQWYKSVSTLLSKQVALENTRKFKYNLVTKLSFKINDAKFKSALKFHEKLLIFA